MVQISFRSKLNRDGPTVFGLYQRPDALTLLTDPRDGRVVREEGKLGIGRRAYVEVPLGPFPVLWVSVVVAWEPPVSFTDESESGPFRAWRHEHRVEPEGESSWLVEHIDYELPMGFLGQIVAGRTVRARLQDTFRRRHRRHAELVGAAITAGFGA